MSVTHIIAGILFLYSIFLASRAGAANQLLKIIFGLYFLTFVLTLVGFKPLLFIVSSVCIILIFGLLLSKQFSSNNGGKQSYLLILFVILLRATKVLHLEGKLVIGYILSAFFLGIVIVLLARGKINRKSYDLYILAGAPFILELLDSYM